MNTKVTRRAVLAGLLSLPILGFAKPTKANGIPKGIFWATKKFEPSLFQQVEDIFGRDNIPTVRVIEIIHNRDQIQITMKVGECSALTVARTGTLEEAKTLFSKLQEKYGRPMVLQSKQQLFTMH